MANNLFQTYLRQNAPFEINLSDNLKSKLISLVKNDIFTGSFEQEDLRKSLELAQSEVVAILAMNSFARYLASEQYSKWREEEFNNTKKFTKNPRASDMAYLTNIFECPQAIGKAFSIIDPNEIKYIITCSQWVTYFISSVDSLPYAVSILCGDSSKESYLTQLYVNSDFEEVTGYERSELVGKHLELLHGEKSEPHSIAAMKSSLKELKSGKVEITYHKRDGTEFKAQQHMKPIFDQNNTGKYIICFLSVDEMGHKVADKHMKLLPGRLRVIQS